MTTVTIGAGEDYATWAAFHTALASPLTDDLTVLVDGGTYNEEMTWAKDNAAHTVLVQNADTSAVIFDAQSTRAYAMHLTVGFIEVFGNFEFKNATTADICTDGTGANGTIRFRGAVKCINGVVGAQLYSENTIYFEGVELRDQTSAGTEVYGSSTWPRYFIGCRGRTTTNITPFSCFAGGSFLADGSRGGFYGCTYRSEVGAGYGADSGFFGGAIYCYRCRSFGSIGMSFRQSWEGTPSYFQECYVDGMWRAYWGFALMGARGNVVLKRCTVRNVTSRGIYSSLTTPSVLAVTNCGIDTANIGVINTTTGTIVLTNVGTYNLAGVRTSGAGITDTNPVTGNPVLRTLAALDGDALPAVGGAWDKTGTADGLIVLRPGDNPDIGCVMIVPPSLRD